MIGIFIKKMFDIFKFRDYLEEGMGGFSFKNVDI